MLVFSAPVSKKHKRCSLKGRVSLCGQRGITLSALQAVPMHESVLVHESLSPRVCVFECTPAIFQLSFIFPCWECLFPSKHVLTCRGSVKEMVLCNTIEEEWVCVSVYVCICLHVWDADYFWQGDTPFLCHFQACVCHTSAVFSLNLSDHKKLTQVENVNHFAASNYFD